MSDLTPSVFVIDDDQALCQSLRWLLESVGLQVETYNSGASFLEKYNPERRGCLLIDIRMPGMSGLELQEQLIARHNLTPIIFITGHGDVPMAVRAMKAGAVDFITKPFNDQLLLELIQKAIAQDLNRPDIHQQRQYAERMAQLTARELEIMKLVVNGKLNKIIAHELGISIKTVELHRAHVMQKMQVKSLAELVKIHSLLERTPHLLQASSDAAS